MQLRYGMSVNAATCAASVIGVLCSATVCAQEVYPSKLIRIVTAAPGSNNDWGARLVAQELTPRLGQQVIVENRGSIGVEVIAKAPPDGHSILFYGSVAWIQPFLTSVSWDALRDLAPITLSMRSPNVVVVHPSVPAKSVKELIALAKARPGELNYGAGGSGASPHLAAALVLLFRTPLRVRRQRIVYGGRAILAFCTSTTTMVRRRSGCRLVGVVGHQYRQQ